jgi:hypothetical protein
MIEEYLYHYSTIDRFENGICRTNCIRLSSIFKVNDPLDYKERVFMLKYPISSNIEEAIDRSNKKDDFQNIVYNKWLKNCKVVCFSIDDSRNNVFGYQLANLWSYYTDKHTGICLKFNKSKLIDFFKSSFVSYFPLSDRVEYKNEIDKLEFDDSHLFDIFEEIKENQKPLFFQKLKSWSNEQEFRLVCFSLNEFEYIPLVGLLDEIILGQNSTLESEFFTKKNFPNVQISKMNYFIGQGGFEKVDIQDSLWKINQSMQ